MVPIHAHGIAVTLPAGFEGRIFRRTSVGGEACYAVGQFASFSMPNQVADFGSGAVNEMTPNDLFIVLFEYGRESIGKRLFQRRGMPRRLMPSDFRPYTLRRGLGGQSGSQWFFTESERPFTLYVVLGSHARRSSLVPRVNGLLHTVTISPPSPASASSSTPVSGKGSL